MDRKYSFITQRASMKMVIGFLILTSTSAFADSWAISKALVDNSEKISEIKKKCNSGVRNVISTELERGTYQHSFSMYPGSRGESKKNCEVVILQDMTPTYADGNVEYSISVKEL
jgi:hypothetical protein